MVQMAAGRLQVWLPAAVWRAERRAAFRLAGPIPGGRGPCWRCGGTNAVGSFSPRWQVPQVIETSGWRSGICARYFSFRSSVIRIMERALSFIGLASEARSWRLAVWQNSHSTPSAPANPRITTRRSVLSGSTLRFLGT